MKRLKVSAVFVLLLFLVSCLPMMQQQQQQLQTPEKKMAYAKATITGVNNGVAELLRSKAITLSTARKYRNSIRVVRPLIAAYETSVRAGDLSNEAQQWKAINSILEELNKYLSEVKK